MMSAVFWEFLAPFPAVCTVSPQIEIRSSDIQVDHACHHNNRKKPSKAPFLHFRSNIFSTSTSFLSIAYLCLLI